MFYNSISHDRHESLSKHVGERYPLNLFVYRIQYVNHLFRSCRYLFPFEISALSFKSHEAVKHCFRRPVPPSTKRRVSTPGFEPVPLHVTVSSRQTGYRCTITFTHG